MISGEEVIQRYNLSEDQLQQVDRISDLVSGVINSANAFGNDPRLTAMAVNHFEQGLMCAVKSISKGGEPRGES